MSATNLRAKQHVRKKHICVVLCDVNDSQNQLVLCCVMSTIHRINWCCAGGCQRFTESIGVVLGDVNNSQNQLVLCWGLSTIHRINWCCAGGCQRFTESIGVVLGYVNDSQNQLVLCWGMSTIHRINVLGDVNDSQNQFFVISTIHRIYWFLGAWFSFRFDIFKRNVLFYFIFECSIKKTNTIQFKRKSGQKMMKIDMKKESWHF
jgi:hypothetical protein